MPNSAIVPSTQMTTSTIGPTAIIANAGWRIVTQKKIPRKGECHQYGGADCLCLSIRDRIRDCERDDSHRSRRDGVVVTEPECLYFFLEHLGSRGIARLGWELEQHCVDALGIVDQKVRCRGILRFEFVDKFLDQPRLV